MRLTRISCAEAAPAGPKSRCPSRPGEHLTRVLRLEAGAASRCSTAPAASTPASSERATERRYRARLGAHSASIANRRCHITLLQGVARGERMDLIVQKATELGVTRIVPVFAERSVVKVDASKRARKLEHWRSIAISACEQCGRNRVPEVASRCAG